MPIRKQVTIILNETLLNSINRLAEASGCPATSLFRVAVLEFLRRNDIDFMLKEKVIGDGKERSLSE